MLSCANLVLYAEELLTTNMPSVIWDDSILQFSFLPSSNGTTIYRTVRYLNNLCRELDSGHEG
jgi:hypothetical protein